MCPVIPTSLSYELAASIYETMANAARVIEQAKEKHIAFPVRLWNFRRDLQAVYLRCASAGGAFFVQSSEGPEAWSGRFRSLHSQIESLYSICKKRGLTNRTMTAATLDSIRKLSDEFLDLAETIDIIADPRTENHFAAARREMESGRLEDFFSLPL